MQLPVMPPVRPMLARAVEVVPRAPGLLYEPKWDGFRCIAFRDGDEVELASRRERPFTRYFPEVAEALRRALPDRCVVDGELVVVSGEGLDFETLQGRIHPAASRVAKLAVETPATFVAFDLLAVGGDDLRERPFRDRRAALVDAVRPGVREDVLVTPLTGDPDVAQDWFTRFEGAGFDGVVAKSSDGPYEEGRRALWKVKHRRTADCVVVGLKVHRNGEGVGSLLLGLYEDGALHHVGAASAFTAAHRRTLLTELTPWRAGAADGPPWRDAVPGEGWGRLTELGWEPLRPERVAEVRYDPVASPWFRSPARLVRWRDDKAPAECTADQLHTVAPAELRDLLGPGRAKRA